MIRMQASGSVINVSLKWIHRKTISKTAAPAMSESTIARTDSLPAKRFRQYTVRKKYKTKETTEAIPVQVRFQAAIPAPRRGAIKKYAASERPNSRIMIWDFFMILSFNYGISSNRSFSSKADSGTAIDTVFPSTNPSHSARKSVDAVYAIVAEYRPGQERRTPAEVRFATAKRPRTNIAKYFQATDR